VRYDDRTRTHALVRMIAPCPACHQVKHMGFASVQGKGAQAPGASGRAHLARVYGWTLDSEGLCLYVLDSEYAPHRPPGRDPAPNSASPVHDKTPTPLRDPCHALRTGRRTDHR
jgi:hypothetical protein